MNQKISVSCALSCLCPARPDKKYGSYGEHLPEDKERKKVSCKDNPQGAAGVNQPSHILHIVFYVNGIENSYERYEMEDVTEQEAQPVHFTKDKIIFHKPYNPMSSFRDIDQVYETCHRDEQHVGAFPFPFYQRNQ